MTRRVPEAATTRARVLAVLRADRRELTLTEIASELELHPNTVRFHVDNLIERGQAEQVATAPRGPGRPAVRVRAVAGMDPQGPRHYRALAEALILGLAGTRNAAKNAQRAGRSWGDRLAGSRLPALASVDPASALTALLDDLGFAPEQIARMEIGLRHCPFLELATSTGDVVCSVHLGLMRGALDTLSADLDVERLEPFARPDLCVAHLTERRPVA